MVSKSGQNRPARARQRNFELLRKIVSIIVILYGLVVVVSGYTYITMDVEVFSWFEDTNMFTDADNWRACEVLCRDAAECQSFRYNNGGCSFSPDALIYGSLDDSQEDGISGQLESKSASASLAWAGIGIFGEKRKHLTPGSTHAECQAACDEFEKCIGYNITDSDTNCDLFTFAYGNSTENNSGNLKNAIRADINGSETEIIGDVFDTRVAANDFPVAPSDIHNSVPNFTLADFHFSKGMENWQEMARVAAETWQNCSSECHNTEFCLSFVFWKDKDNNITQCDMYDAAILGRVRTGIDKYGVIDRWQGEGAVSSLVGFRNEGNGLAGFKLLSYNNYDIEGTTTDECAKLCQKFHEPRVCIAFFFQTTFKQCYLYDSLPCVGPRGANSTAFAGGAWDKEKYQFGYFENRIPPTQTDNVPQSQTKAEKVPVHFRMHSGGCVVNGVSPKKEVPIDIQGALPSQMRLRCLHLCYYERAWCKAFVLDLASKICKLYDVKVNNTNGDNNCLHGVATTP